MEKVSVGILLVLWMGAMGESWGQVSLSTHEALVEKSEEITSLEVEGPVENTPTSITASPSSVPAEERAVAASFESSEAPLQPEVAEVKTEQGLSETREPGVNGQEALQPVSISFVQPILALAVVFGLMFLIAWFLKKSRLVGTMPKGLLKQVAVLPLGNKESVVIVECKDTWLVLGVTAHQITLLHTLSKESLADSQMETHGTPFKTWLDSTIDRFRQSQSS